MILLLFHIVQIEPQNIFEYFFSLENPALYSLLFVILIMVLVVLIRREFISPLAKRKRELELENTKLMALFAEIDPDPILRVNQQNFIISANNTALKIFDNDKLIGAEIESVLPNFTKNQSEAQENEIIRIHSNFYSISTKEVEYLNFKQIYLHDITKRIKYENQIEQYQKRLRQLRTKLENINESEKQRLGKELHDGIGQNISVIKIELQKYLEADHRNDKHVFTNLINLIDDLSNDIRDISHQLRPRILNEFGLLPALSSLIDSVNNSSKMKGLLANTDSEFDLNQELELNIYRICQEAITNIIKHSQCGNFFIQFVKSNDDLRIIISDDGNGFDLSEYSRSGSPSLGLLNMKERAANFGGELNIESNINEGTTIFAIFPKVNQWT